MTARKGWRASPPIARSMTRAAEAAHRNARASKRARWSSIRRAIGAEGTFVGWGDILPDSAHRGWNQDRIGRIRRGRRWPVTRHVDTSLRVRRDVAVASEAVGAQDGGARATGRGWLGLGALTLGALAVGAIGVLAIGRLRVGSLARRSGRIRKLRIEELEIGRLHIRDGDVTGLVEGE